MSELYDVLLNEADPYALRLANELYPMARGLEAEAFNCRTNIEVRASPLVVFGLKNVPNPMKARRIRQVQQLTWNQMLTNVNLRPTLEIVDEAWFLLQHAHTASDLAERARRFRKKNGALVIATQHAEDFAHSRSAEAVLEIAASHLLFRQKPNAIDRLALLFKLLPGEARSLVTMRTGDYLFLSSNLRLLLHKQVPASRDELYTTRPSEVQAYRERRRRRDDRRPTTDDRARTDGQSSGGLSSVVGRPSHP